MATLSSFAYNPGDSIDGTEQLGSLSIGEPTSGFTNNPQYWNGPDEELGYVIAQSVSGNTQPTPIPGVFASVGFFRSTDLTEGSFITLSETIAGQSFATGADAKTWLNNNGYWTSYVVSGVTPTPTGTPATTPTSTPTMYYYNVSGYSCGVSCSLVGSYNVMSPTPLTIGYFYNNPENRGYTFEILSLIPQVGGAYDLTGEPGFAVCIDACNQPSPTPTPTLTQTPTSTDLTNITTYTISGCTSLNEFVANLGPGALAPGDIFYFEFTGGTPSGCYRIVNKINAVPTDGTTPLYFYTSCALCVAAREVTPTPTITQTPTTTPTPSVTPTPTPTSGASGNFNVTISQVGLDVVWSGSGFFNLAALSSTGPGSVSSGFNAGQAIWAIGVSAATDTYSGTSLTYPTSFGTGGVGVTSSSGSTVGILPGPPGVPRALYVPSGYVSNTTISGSATYANNTIAGMGLSAGTYTWNFTTGGNSTALVMNIVA